MQFETSWKKLKEKLNNKLIKLSFKRVKSEPRIYIK